MENIQCEGCGAGGRAALAHCTPSCNIHARSYTSLDIATDSRARGPSLRHGTFAPRRVEQNNRHK